MDDIDDVLDEIEKELDQKDKRVPKKPAVNVKKDLGKVDKRKVQKPLHEWDDIDQDIDDILGEGQDITIQRLAKDPIPVPQKTSNAGCQKAKCFPLHLGGSRMTKGLCVGPLKRSCNNLRCTSCDFKIISFDDYQWHSSADYLFFRNTMPDRSKLQSKLRKSHGTVSYCCQCSWKSVKEPTAISQFKDLKWVCGKH